MAPYFFKLSDPSTQREPSVAETPSWLEEHFSRMNSDNDEATLGNIDTTLMKSEPSDSFSSTFYGSNYNVPSYPNVQNSAAKLPWSNKTQNDPKFWENTEDGFSSSFSLETKDIPVGKPINPKQFCDNLYMRLMNLFFVLADEKQTAKTQAELLQAVHEIENSYVKK